MIRNVAYTILVSLFITCSLVSLATGVGGVHEFEISAPDSLGDYVTFVPNLIIDFVQFLVSCITWEFAPGLPGDLKTALIAMSTLPIGYVIIVDIVPPLATAISKIIDAILPG